MNPLPQPDSREWARRLVDKFVEAAESSKAVTGAPQVLRDSTKVEMLKHVETTVRVALKGVLGPEDHRALQELRLWILISAWRIDLMEPLAEIGHRVKSGGRKRAGGEEGPPEHHAELVSAACWFLSRGARPHGLASKVKKRARSRLSVRQINRILDQWIPLLLAGPQPEENRTSNS